MFKSTSYISCIYFSCLVFDYAYHLVHALENRKYRTFGAAEPFPYLTGRHGGQILFSRYFKSCTNCFFLCKFCSGIIINSLHHKNICLHNVTFIINEKYYFVNTRRGNPRRHVRGVAHCVRFVFCGGQSVSAIGSLPDGMQQKVSRAALRATPQTGNDKLIACSSSKLTVEQKIN